MVCRLSRFTRKREHAVAIKSMLRRKGIRVVSITEQGEDSGRPQEAIIEIVDEFYLENLAQRREHPHYTSVKSLLGTIAKYTRTANTP